MMVIDTNENEYEMEIWTPCQKRQRMTSKCETDYSIQSPCFSFPRPHCASVGGISDVSKPLARAKPLVPSADQRVAHLCLLYMQAVQLLRPGSILPSVGPSFTTRAGLPFTHNQTLGHRTLKDWGLGPKPCTLVSQSCSSTRAFCVREQVVNN